ncbi:MAG: S1C family serine protease [Chloroflexota bacterium]
MGLSEALGGVERAAAELVNRTVPSVVQVRAGHGCGAGIIWRADGLIVTNDHVAQADGVDVDLWDGRTYAGRVLARDRRHDLAIVRIDARDLPAVRHRAHAARPGELVVALGHPFGERYSATVGIVASGTSATSGAVERGQQLIQADVQIGPGSSGGPLLDANGLVIGVTSMIGGGMALAVPSRLAEALVLAVVQFAAA